MINLRRINLNLLTFFEALYQEKNLTAAAERIHVSQPAMSNALRRLRATFNDQLFIRTGYSMEPTPRARRLAPSILEALNRVREGIDDNREFDPTIPRTFNIGGIDHVDLIAIPTLVSRNTDHLSTVHYNSVAISGGDYEESLRTNQVDLIIDVQAPAQAQLQVAPIMVRHVVPVVRKDHPLAGQRLEEELLKTLKFALLSHRQVTSMEAVEAFLRDQNLLENVAVRVSHFRSIFDIVCNSDLVGFFPESTVALHSEELVALEMDITPIEITHYMIWHEFQAEDPGHLWLRREIEAIYGTVEVLPDSGK